MASRTLAIRVSSYFFMVVIPRGLDPNPEFQYTKLADIYDSDPYIVYLFSGFKPTLRKRCSDGLVMEMFKILMAHPTTMSKFSSTYFIGSLLFSARAKQKVRAFVGK